nr:MAG TPA: hypothetical protein [Caudoviricetes sp.]
MRLLYTKRYESYQLIRMVCVGIMVYQSSPLSSPKINSCQDTCQF